MILETQYGIMEGLIFPAPLISGIGLTINGKKIKNYEDLFEDVLNASPMLRSRVLEPYHVPSQPVSFHRIGEYQDKVFFRSKTESNKEPDFVTDGHVFDLDLKLLITNCHAEVASFVSQNQELTLSDKSFEVKNGATTKMERSGKEHSMEFFYVQSICFRDRFDQNSGDPKRELEKDHIRKIMRTEKNIVIIFPYWLTISKTEFVPLEEQAVEMVSALDYIFCRVFAYRCEEQPHLATFFLFVMNNPESGNPADYAMCLTEVKDGHLDRSRIELIESPKEISCLLFDLYMKNLIKEYCNA